MLTLDIPRKDVSWRDGLPAPARYPSRYVFPPPIKRTGYPKPMTIALGILAGSTQILAADTQMSTDVEKFGSGKISFLASMPTTTSAGGSIAIAGSGDEPNLRSLQDEISELFSATKTESMHELGNGIQRLIKQFYRDYISITPDMNQRPDVELIIAARRGEYSQMWVSRRNKLSKAHSPVAVGSGAAYARSIIGNLMLPQQPETAMVLAAYVVFLVKLRNMWVGMDTQVLALDDSTVLLPKAISATLCRRLEESFRRCIGVQGRVLHRMFGSGYKFCDAALVAADIETMREEFLSMIIPASPQDPQPTDP